MTHIRPFTRLATLALTLGLLGGCGSSKPEDGQRSEEGRQETRTIRNTEAIGYSGDAIADKVDAALDANDQRAQRLEEEEATNY